LLLARGEVSYFGPATDAVAYFSGLSLSCPSFSNPADYFMDIISDDTRSEQIQVESEARVTMILNAYKETENFKKSLTRPEPSGGALSWTKGANFLMQCVILFSRAAHTAYRDYKTNGIRLVQNLVISILMGLVYLNLGHDQASITDRLGLMFFIILNQAMNAMFFTLNVFTGDKKVINHERRAGMYSVSSYFLSKTLVELPLQLFFFPTIFATIIYWMAGLQRCAYKFFIFLVVVELTTFTGESVGLAFSSIFDNFAMSSALAPILMIFFLLYSGFYVNNSSVPPEFIWVPYISFVRWGFEALVLNEFSGLELYCKKGQEDESGVCSTTTGEQVITRLDFNGTPIVVPIMVLLAETLLLRFIAYLALRLRKPKQK